MEIKTGMTVEEYQEWEKEMSQLTREETIALILNSFQSALREPMKVGYEPRLASALVFCFRDQDLVEDIQREKTLILTDPSKTAKDFAEALEIAKTALESYRRAPGICAIFRALMPHVGESIALTHYDLGVECVVLFRDQELYEKVMGRAVKDV